ncbi:Na(+)-dependent transporter [Bacterioplanes sanyensis]|uniref:Na(+)-dependent transporter n=1 Tax=Bacterioplanes sanyensis TaxID=1249553 RepID=A0A222FIV7_9GAMM|nr:bile acid:sodium symporter family protein [Bacterioplanes sanyensis]ASP38977.1 Na(+)-dependent transporter [Bacterioplanes sanyensis]
MHTVISQWILPLALASMMLVMGLSLTLGHFRQVLQRPKEVLLGLSLQWLLLPVLAVAWISWLQLPVALATGLVLLAACPGGATSNIISHLSGGDGALSVTLTAVVSVLAPLLIPLSVNAQLALLDSPQLTMSLPWLQTALPLLLITAVPLMIGMIIAHRWPVWVQRRQESLNRLAFFAFMTLVVWMTITNLERLPQLWSATTLACLGLCVSAMLITRLLSHPCQRATRQTLMVEVGIQNAGTAMVIAASILGQPELALVALFYGILMNGPALLLMLRQQWRQGSYNQHSTWTEKRY